MPKNIIIITARLNSQRLPRKALVDLLGEPNLERTVNRFAQCKRINEIIVATTNDPSDDEIAQWCESNGVRFHRAPKGNILGQILEIARNQKADYVLRATCDCPFISWELVDMAFDLVARFKIDQQPADSARVWGMSERGVPVYGASEMPVRIDAIERMDKAIPSDSHLREHGFADMDANRLRYKMIYAVPPQSYQETFYRPYRLELDTEQDLILVRGVMEQLGTQPALHDVIHFLDMNQKLSRVNSIISEKTGPLTSYSREQVARWKHQQALYSQEWRGDWSWLASASPANLPEGAKAIRCKGHRCYLGYEIVNSAGTPQLHRRDGTIITGRASLKCDCGANGAWSSNVIREPNSAIGLGVLT